MNPNQTTLSKNWRFLTLSGIGIVIIVLGLLLPQWFVKANDANAAPADQVAMFPLIARFLGMSTVVLVLCGGAAYIARRRMKTVAHSGTENLQILEALAIGGRCCVHLVRAEGQLLLAGVDGAGLKMLLHVSSDDAVDEALTTTPLTQAAA